MLNNEFIVVDNFAGGGGASVGIERGLGRHVDFAINHDIDAIRMHQVNHPKTIHFCENIFDVDPSEVVEDKRVGLAWFSPDCTHYSIARGGKPVDKNIRGLAWSIVRWCSAVDVDVFMMENVREFVSWCPLIDSRPDKLKYGLFFDGFIKALTTGLKRDHEAWGDMIDALGCDFKGIDKIENGLGYQIEHKLINAEEYGIPTSRARFFLIGRKDGKPIVWPRPTHGNGRLPLKTAREIIDWSIQSKSIFKRNRPLAENTLKRIKNGIEKHCSQEIKPFIVRIGHTKFGGDKMSYSIDVPLTTITSKAEHCLIQPVRKESFILKYYGCLKGQHSSIEKPLHTITGRDCFGLVDVVSLPSNEFDIHLRMLQPHELFAAQGFPSDYIFDRDISGKKFTKEIQVAKCGNSVCPGIAEILVRENITKLK